MVILAQKHPAHLKLKPYVCEAAKTRKRAYNGLWMGYKITDYFERIQSVQKKIWRLKTCKTFLLISRTINKENKIIQVTFTALLFVPLNRASSCLLCYVWMCSAGSE